MSGLERFVQELRRDPALVYTILSRPDLFPALPACPETVTVLVTHTDLDRGLARAFALAAEGVTAHVELIKNEG